MGVAERNGQCQSTIDATRLVETCDDGGYSGPVAVPLLRTFVWPGYNCIAPTEALMSKDRR